MMYDVFGSMMRMSSPVNHEIDLTELNKLADGLTAKGIEFERRPLFDGAQILCADWDAVCHKGSYGGLQGKLEIMGTIVRNEDDDVEGYLTAAEILARV